MIKEIRIQNFKGIEQLKITPKKMNILIGPNGTGKSSVLDAIRFALTGVASPSDVRIGNDQAGVLLILDDGTQFTRILSAKGRGSQTCLLNDKKLIAKDAEKFIVDRFGCSTETMKSLCGSDFLANLSGKDANNYILSLLPLNINFNSLKKFMEEYKGGALSDLENDMLRDAITSDKMSLDELETLHKKFFDDRRVANRLLKEKKAQASFNESKIDGMPDMDSLKKEKEGLLKEKGKMEVFEKMIAMKARLTTLRDEHKKLIGMEEPDPAKKQEHIDIKAKLEARILTLSKTVATLKANNALFEKILSRIDTNVCPISDKITCHTDKTAAKDEITQMMLKNANDISKAEETIALYKDQIIKRDKLIERCNQDAVLWEKKVGLENEILAIQIPDVESPKMNEDQVKARLAYIDEAEKVWRSYELAMKAKDDAEKQGETAKALDFLVKATDGKGVRALILNKAMTALTKRTNSLANLLHPGLEVKFKTEDGFTMYLKFHDEFVPVNKLSSGERILAIFLLMEMIRSVTGANILLIDSLDQLDNNSIDSLLSLLTRNDIFETMFFGMVDHQDTVDLVKGMSNPKLTTYKF